MKEKPTSPVSPPVPSKLAVVNTGQPASPTSIPTLVTESASVSPNSVDSYSSPEPEGTRKFDESSFSFSFFLYLCYDHPVSTQLLAIQST